MAKKRTKPKKGTKKRAKKAAKKTIRKARKKIRAGDKIIHEDPEEVKLLKETKYSEKPKVEKTKYEGLDEAEKPEPAPPEED